MSMWTTQTICPAAPEEVLEVLTDPDAIARWSPLPFQVLGFDDSRLRAGDRVRVRGELAGRGVEFLVEVAEAGDGRLTLTATGPVRFDVRYRVSPCGRSSRVAASVGVAGSGLLGRVLARAVDGMLAAGALHAALGRIAGELAPVAAA